MDKNNLLFKKIFDDFPALIWLAGNDAKCWYFNKQWLTFRGRSLEQEYGDGWAEGVHPDDFNRCLETYLTNFNARTPFSMEYRLMRHDGEYRWILDMGIPFFGPTNDFEGYIGSCYDVTEEKAHTDNLVHAKEEALASAESKTKLLSYVSHEIRNAVNIIYGYIQLLSMQPFDDETNELIGTMKASATTLVGLINNVLDYTKHEDKQQANDIKAIEPSRLAQQIERIYRPKIEQSGLQFILALDQTLPMTFRTDEVKLLQIIANLLGNAIKFTPSGSITLAFDWLESDKQLKVSIVDTGIGINEEKQKSLFKAYFQGDSTSFMEYGGSGLGLSIVMSLVTALGGKLAVETTIGVGTRFDVYLPAI